MTPNLLPFSAEQPLFNVEPDAQYFTHLLSSTCDGRFARNLGHSATCYAVSAIDGLWPYFFVYLDHKCLEALANPDFRPPVPLPLNSLIWPSELWFVSCCLAPMN